MEDGRRQNSIRYTREKSSRTAKCSFRFGTTSQRERFTNIALDLLIEWGSRQIRILAKSPNRFCVEYRPDGRVAPRPRIPPLRAAAPESGLDLSCACRGKTATTRVVGPIPFSRCRKASNRISPGAAKAASIAIQACRRNPSRTAGLAVGGRLRYFASSSRCLRANGMDGGHSKAAD